MSTRSQIIVCKQTEDNKVDVIKNYYHHHDGYIEGGVGEELIDHINAPITFMDNDSEYEDETNCGRVTHHVDIEFLYYIVLQPNGEFVLYVVSEDEWWDSLNEKWTFNSAWTQERLHHITRDKKGTIVVSKVNVTSN